MIVSDTHRKLRTLEQALSNEGEIDMLIHLGDFEGDDEAIAGMCGCKMLIVPGNNDFFTGYPKEIETEIAGRKVLITHGHYYMVSLDLRTIEDEARSRGMDIVMFGHTHKPVIQTINGVTLINPGSLSYPRQQDRKCSYIMMEVDDENELHYTLKKLDIF
jgi:putative phosphoesterase